QAGVARAVARPPMPAVVPMLRLANVEVVYDDVILVLKGLSLEVPKGQDVALLGPNGAGKSTTLKAISCLLRAAEGEVTDRALVALPRLILLDEPSLGLAPLLVQEIFRIIAKINQEEKTTMLLVEQNANVALSIAHFGYIMENGRIVLDGESEKLKSNEDVREFYLGGGEGKKSYKAVKSYRRRKRWLS